MGVHRIQNRNPGYSDFVNSGSAQSFNFSSSSPITNGANALKLENEIITEPVTNSSSSEMLGEQTANNQEIENIIEDNELNDYEQSFSGDTLDTVNESEEKNS